MIADDLRAALSPAAFAESLGIVPDAWQRDVLESGANRALLLCARQTGKSTTAAILALHEARFQPGALVLLVSPSLRQSSELFRNVARLHAISDPHGTVTDSETMHRLELQNGSRILSLPGSEQTIRGFAGVSTLILDEASRVEDDLYRAVLPMLATTNGRCIALTTPFGRRGWFSDAWHGAQQWQRVKVTAHDCPRISPAFLQEQRELMGDLWFRQEFLCEFEDSVSSAFRAVDIERAQQERIEQWTL